MATLPRLDRSPEPHGGNLEAAAARLGCRPEQLLDASASLVPFGPPPALVQLLRRSLAGTALRAYPDRGYTGLRQVLAAHHKVPPDWVLPGNGAAELFTWAGRDAAAAGLSLLPTPGFADYPRALRTWDGLWQPLPLPLVWQASFPQPFPPFVEQAAVLWITNPHNPSGQLWSRASLESLLPCFALVIADEAFLPLLPSGEAQSLVPLLADHPNLVVIRSLTKMFAIAGLRLGYALAHPERLARWAAWRDPWPVNGLAARAGEAVIGDRRWQQRVQRWLAREGPWLQGQLQALPGVMPMPSAANFLLLRRPPTSEPDRVGDLDSLEPLRLALEHRHRLLVRSCSSFEGLGSGWLRLAIQDRRGNRRMLRALQQELGSGPRDV